jgi:phosphate transport system substrate-binding protein
MKSLALLCVAAVLFAASSIKPAHAEQEIGGQAITGAGSTFAYPIISEWSRAYDRARFENEYDVGGSGLDSPPPGRTLNYEPLGSFAGMLRVQSGQVDFAASDVPLKSEDLAKLGLGQFPLVMGGVVAAVNIDGVEPGRLKLTGPLLADIFLGTVTTWNHPAIVALNPNLKLPEARIIIVYRSDGSGTTYNFADYLSKVSPAWKEKMGVDTLLLWSLGTSAKGNEGVSLAVKQTENSIGYVEYAQAAKAQLSYALIQNRAGKFVKPEPASFQAAAATADWTNTKDSYMKISNAPGEAAYPIAATVFVFMRKEANWARPPEPTVKFFQWALEHGAKDAAVLGYVPLPAGLVHQVKDYWTRTFE